ncbi:lipoyl(octanoyl) transferase LipB [Pyrobaculum ferrireducens]|uniref:Probable octanoyltransferase n=1 Tax=Pyrobaculum ferrireducens TaxID=1104324 RepID=G7VHG8_9CREN|nr:lipoyl(octanoyl) transferase LipB [Pyrobaculum ferrireducens]AET33259.1 lipoate protein ligase B [Pyrobaculum ferrireducens]
MKVVWLGRTAYHEAWRLMKSLHRAVSAGQAEEVALVTEHEPVVTVGKHGRLNNVLRWDVPVYVVERGGDATYHGPGQAVIYPIIRLRWPLRRYIDALEDAVIETLRKYGVEAGKNPSHRGVWLGGRKIASVGIAVENNVAYHGVAVNVSLDVGEFARINPCGLPPSAMISMKDLGIHADVREVGVETAVNLAEILGLHTEIAPRPPEAPPVAEELKPAEPPRQITARP